jgi:hypothetical protein
VPHNLQAHRTKVAEHRALYFSSAKQLLTKTQHHITVGLRKGLRPHLPTCAISQTVNIYRKAQVVKRRKPLPGYMKLGIMW